MYSRLPLVYQTDLKLLGNYVSSADRLKSLALWSDKRNNSLYRNDLFFFFFFFFTNLLNSTAINVRYSTYVWNSSFRAANSNTTRTTNIASIEIFQLRHIPISRQTANSLKVRRGFELQLCVLAKILSILLFSNVLDFFPQNSSFRENGAEKTRETSGGLFKGSSTSKRKTCFAISILRAERNILSAGRCVLSRRETRDQRGLTSNTIP